MIKDKKILITGVTGKAVLPLAAALAADNEVWGQARFQSQTDRDKVAVLGIRPCAADLEIGDLSEVPDDADFLLHFAWMRAAGDELKQALRVNVEGTGLILHHCRRAKAALVVSSMSVYEAVPDPWHRYAEKDPIGVSPTQAAATSPISKIGFESIAGFSARAYGLPMVIARLTTVLGPHLAYYGKQLTGILEGRTIVLPSESSTHNPIHSEDMIRQIEPLLDAAAREPLTVNWCGDEVAVSQDTVVRLGELAGKTPRCEVKSVPGIAGGNLADNTRRLSITGPCETGFWDGLEQMAAEMLHGASCPLAQRDWAYASAEQNMIYQG
jgi:UDP-glucuronate 4-epimerase